MNGILCLNKPEGISSFLAVRICRGIFSVKKAGHAGTLDPLATGVLPILIGNATGLSDRFLAEQKAYRATFLIGQATDTQDVTGEVIARSDVRPSFEALSAAAESFLGQSMQLPPMYSALKKDGRPLYELARRGEQVERTPRPITVYEISLSEGERVGEYSLFVRASKGTYIRTLICDIAQKCQALATMSTLCRTEHGPFTLADAVTLDELKVLADDREALAGLLYSPERMLEALPTVTLSAFYARLARAGAEIYVTRARVGRELPLGAQVRMYDENGVFFALGEKRAFPEGEAVKPIKLFL